MSGPNKEEMKRKRQVRPKKTDEKHESGESLKCAQCDSIVQTYASPEATYITVIASCITILVFGIWCMFLLPFVVPLSKSIVLRCCRCDANLEVRQPFGLFSLKDEVLTLKCGECALVISRSYLLTAVSIILCILIYFWASTEVVVQPKFFINSTWTEYLDDCGGEVVLKNSIRATDTFNRNYEGKTITWQGYLMRATQNYGWFRGEHAAVILVKMQPSESDIHADLILSMDDQDFYENTSALASLDKGSLFKFNATFISPGNEQQLHHLHAHYIEKLDGYMEIPAHVHNVNQRYNLNGKAQSSITS